MKTKTEDLLEKIRDLRVQIASAGYYGIRGGRINGCDPFAIREILIDKQVELVREYLEAGGDKAKLP